VITFVLRLFCNMLVLVSWLAGVQALAFLK